MVEQSRATLNAACAEGERAACALAASIAGRVPQRVGEIADEGPVDREDEEYGEEDGREKPERAPVQGPTAKQLLAACTAGEPAACALAPVEDSVVVAAYAAACARGDLDACARPEQRYERTDGAALLAARDAGSVLALARWIAESRHDRDDALKSVPWAREVAARACVDGHPDACDLHLIALLDRPLGLDLRPLCRTTKIACSEQRSHTWLRDQHDDCRKAQEVCGRIVSPTDAFTVAKAEQDCLGDNKYECDDAAKAFLEGGPDVERDLDEARRYAKVGCERGNSSSCKLLEATDSKAPTALTPGLEECIEQSSCPILQQFIENPESIRNTPGLRTMLERKCASPHGLLGCDLLAIARLRGIDGPRDVAGALVAAEEGCLPPSSHAVECRSLAELLRDPDTRSSAERLACILGKGSDCETKGLLLAGPGVALDAPANVHPVEIVGDWAVFVGTEHVAIHELATGKRVAEHRWRTAPQPVQRGGANVGTYEDVRAVTLAASTSGPLGIISLYRSLDGKGGPVAVALGPNLAFKQISGLSGDIVGVAVDSTNTRAWVAVAGSSGRKLVTVDLVTGAVVGPALEIEYVERLALVRDGKTLVVSTSSHVYEIDGATRTLTTRDVPAGTTIDMAPDGTRAFVSAGRSTFAWTLRVLEPAPARDVLTFKNLGRTGDWQAPELPLVMGWGLSRLHDPSTGRAISLPADRILPGPGGYLVQRRDTWSWHGPRASSPKPAPSWAAKATPLPPSPPTVLPETSTRTYTFKAQTPKGEPLAKVQITGTPVAEYRTNAQLAAVAAKVKPWSGVTDAKGFFVVRDVPRGMFDVEARAPGLAPVVISALDLAAERYGQPHVVVAAPPLLVTGTAKTPDGKPVAGLLVRLKSTDSRVPDPEAISDATGAFSFPRPQYLYTAEISATTTDGVHLKMKGPPDEPFALRVPSRGHREIVEFVAMGESGRPLAGIAIDGAETGADGRVALWRPENAAFVAGEYSLSLGVRAPAQERHIELGNMAYSENDEPAGRTRHDGATARTVDGHTEYVITLPDGEIAFDLPDPAAWKLRQFSPERVEGRYVDPELNGGWDTVAGPPVRYLPAGVYRFTGLADDGRRLTTREIELKAGARVVVKPEITQPRTITGRLLARDGKPVAGVLVISARTPITPTPTDADGRFEIRGAPTWTHPALVRKPKTGNEGTDPLGAIVLPTGVTALGDVRLDDALLALDRQIGHDAFAHEYNGKLRLFVSRQAPAAWLDLFGPLARGGDLPTLGGSHRNHVGFVLRSVNGEPVSTRMTEFEFVLAASRSEVATLVVDDAAGRSVEVKVPRKLWVSEKRR